MELGAVDLIARLLLVLALVFANGFFVAAEFSLVTVRKTRVDQLIAEGNRLARTVRRAITDPDSYIAATQLGITMASLGLGWIGEPAVAAAIEPAFHFLPRPIATGTAHSISVAVAFAIITALHIVLGELAPKTVALQHAERTALIVTKPTELFMKVFWPFITALNGMGRAVVNVFGLQPPSGHAMVHSETELKMLVTASQEAGVLEENEEAMLHRVFEFANWSAGQLMVPRTEMTALPVDAPLDQVLETFIARRHTSLPVYRETLDNVIGLVHITDLLRIVAAQHATFDLGSIVREPLMVPETMKADDLLAELREQQAHLAIVFDEYGSTIGLVTFEALIERIVGELGIQPTATGRRIVVLPTGAAHVDGLALVTDVNQQFGLHIDEETYTTIGGYVLGRLGREPRLGDVVEVEQRRMTVEAVDGLRVARVRISPPRRAKPPSERAE